MLMNHSSLNTLNCIGKIKLNSTNSSSTSQSDNNTNHNSSNNNDEDDDADDCKANILLNGDDLNGDDLIDFGNIPSESAHLTVPPPSLPPPLPNYHASSSSGNYSDSSSLSFSSSASSSCSSSSMHSVNESLSPTIEFEIIKSIENLLDEYSWSARYTQPDNLLLECKSCDFIINVTNFVHKFKHKLNTNLNSTLNCSVHDHLKQFTELIQLYLAKLIHIILVRHNCHQTDHANEFLLIKNFFKQLNKLESTSGESVSSERFFSFFFQTFSSNSFG